MILCVFGGRALYKKDVYDTIKKRRREDMAKLSIVKLFRDNLFCKGTCLRMKSREICEDEIKAEWFRKLVADMLETLYSNPTGVGLAANQVGVLLSVCVVDIKRDGKTPLVLINPSYSAISDVKVESNEVCLSFPNTKTRLKRYKSINVEYVDMGGERQTIVAEGFKANVFQHEIDHLYGKPHVDSAEDISDVTEYKGNAYILAERALESINVGEVRNEAG